jgi:hypothetical protein
MIKPKRVMAAQSAAITLLKSQNPKDEWRKAPPLIFWV